MCQVILNADDMGYSPAVNRAILHAASDGILTAASLMVNMPYVEEAVKSVRESLPHLSLGLHFCLTSGQAVASAKRISLLIDSQGCFRHGFLGLWRLLNSPQKNDVIEQIRIEFHAQLERMDHYVREYGLRFDHLDSHQHVHVFTEIFNILEGESHKRNVVLRVPREHFGTRKRTFHRFFSWLPSGLVKKWILDHHLRQRKQTVGYFGVLDTGKMERQSLIHILETIAHKPAEETFEINIHPSEQGICTSDSNSCDVKFHRSPWRRREYDALLNPNLKSIVERKGIKLIGFSSVITHERSSN